MNIKSTVFNRALKLIILVLIVLYSFSFGEERFFNLPPCLGNRITSALLDSSGTLWASTQGQGLYYLKADEKKWKKAEPSAIFPILKISMPWLKMLREEYGLEPIGGDYVFGMAGNGNNILTRPHINLNLGFNMIVNVECVYDSCAGPVIGENPDSCRNNTIQSLCRDNNGIIFPVKIMSIIPELK